VAQEVTAERGGASPGDVRGRPRRSAAGPRSSAGRAARRRGCAPTFRRARRPVRVGPCGGRDEDPRWLLQRGDECHPSFLGGTSTRRRERPIFLLETPIQGNRCHPSCTQPPPPGDRSDPSCCWTRLYHETGAPILHAAASSWRRVPAISGAEAKAPPDGFTACRPPRAGAPGGLRAACHPRLGRVGGPCFWSSGTTRAIASIGARMPPTTAETSDKTKAIPSSSRFHHGRPIAARRGQRGARRAHAEQARTHSRTPRPRHGWRGWA
jgi:hypothetical protein